MSLRNYYMQKRHDEVRARNEAYSLLSFGQKITFSKELIKYFWKLFLGLAAVLGLILFLANIIFSNMMSVEYMGPARGLGFIGANGMDLLGVWVRNFLVGFAFQACVIGLAALMFHIVDKGRPENPVLLLFSPWERGRSLAVHLLYWLAVSFLFLGAASQLIKVPVAGIWLFGAAFFLVLAVNCCAMFDLAGRFDVDFLEAALEPLKLIRINPLAWVEAAMVLAVGYSLPFALYYLTGFLPALVAYILLMPLVVITYICGPFFGLVFAGYTYKQTKAELDLEESGQILTLGEGGIR